MNPLSLVVLLFTAAVWSACAVADRVGSLPNRVQTPQSVAATTPPAFLGTGAGAFVISIPAMQPDLTSAIPGMKKTGIVYTLPAPATASQFTWEPVNGGHAARIRVAAENGLRLRIHLTLAEDVPTIQFRVQGDSDAVPRGPIEAEAIHDGEIWLPVTTGNGANLEIFVGASVAPETLSPSVDAVNLILEDVTAGGAGSGITARSLAYAQEREYDVTCWSNLSIYAALQQAAAATAKISFIKNGDSYMCSGTLLNDKGHTGTPWFATANHCVPNQSVANTLDFEWLYQATTCGGSTTDPRYAQTSGGAQLLWSNFTWEASFLRLNQLPPAGTVFSGWDTTIHVNDPVWGVHHPEGDHTMASQGVVQDLLQVTIDASQRGSHRLDDVQFQDGGTEAGSSGSGLFSLSTTSSDSYWKGTLFGGPVYDYQSSSYSHFDSYYPYIRQWLGSCALPWGGAITDGQSVTAYQTDVSANCTAAAETRACSEGSLSGSYGYQNCVTPAVAPCALPWGGTLASGQSIIAYQTNVSANCTAVAETRTCSGGVLSGSYGYANCVVPIPVSCALPWGGTLPDGQGVTAYAAETSADCGAAAEVRTCVGGILSGTYQRPDCRSSETDLVVGSPNGGEFFQGGTLDIRWGVPADRRNIKIFLSRDGGETWRLIKAGALKSGHWTYRIKRKDASERARIRVCSMRPAPRVCDSSDGDFVIEWP